MAAATALLTAHNQLQSSMHTLRTELGPDARETRADSTEPPAFLIVGSNHCSLFVAEQRDIDSTRYVP